jgi:hypothetical protein
VLNRGGLVVVLLAIPVCRCARTEGIYMYYLTSIYSHLRPPPPRDVGATRRGYSLLIYEYSIIRIIHNILIARRLRVRRRFIALL